MLKLKLVILKIIIVIWVVSMFVLNITIGALRMPTERLPYIIGSMHSLLLIPFFTQKHHKTHLVLFVFYILAIVVGIVVINIPKLIASFSIEPYKTYFLCVEIVLGGNTLISAVFLDFIIKLKRSSQQQRRKNMGQSYIEF